VKNIRRATRKRHSPEKKIRIVLDGLRGETSIAELCRREGIAESLYYAWSKEFLKAGKRRLVGDTTRAAFGGGVEYSLSQQWSAKLEYLFMGYGGSTNAYASLRRFGAIIHLIKK
jgi:transposase